jgi:DNA (cytosine-5)-methyltransferase 1
MAHGRLRVAGLFAGIGGLELGLARAGHHTELLCELEPGAVAVLRRRFPKVPVHEDVTTLGRLPRDVNLVVAGFPCQDLSQAGLTKGLGGQQSSLVDHVFRLLRKQDIPWVVLENVPFMLQLARGNAIRHVTGQLETLGYSWAYRVIDTRAFGLPQRRERVFIVASKERSPAAMLFEASRRPREAAAASSVACGFFWTEGLRGLGWAIDAVPTLKGGSTIGIPSPPAIWMPDGRFVTPDIRDAERLQGFDPDWSLPAADVGRSSHRWKLVGNAVSVPVAEWIGTRLDAKTTWRPALPIPFDRRAAWPRAAFSDDGDAWAVEVSTWPVAEPAPRLEDFLQFATKPLSQRALEGFWSRLSRGNLKRPAAFDRDLQRAIAAGAAQAVGRPTSHVRSGRRPTRAAR